ncbi:collagen-like protein [Photorhabdus sp. APURE]|uniref:collagen-like triple helix repeat-containing protein n=1 Tax=Photorhabdus aballayi TaxID=2991723 RepID=UPI00223CB28E|nr:collagen-like protein [Photorhabdus aballayi]MCW7546992.1 collagen-like protein [Photorhabdus aballayi]
MDKIRTVTETLAILHQYHHPFGLERQPKQLKTSDFDGPVIFSKDPKTATVPPAFFTVQTIQELKALSGVPDSRYGPGKIEPYHPLPEPFSAERLANVPANHIDLCKAFRAYIHGDSALVKDYEEILNAKRFPMKIALYSGDEITITANNPLIIKDKDQSDEPIVLVYDRITIGPEGKVICCANGRIEANVIQGAESGPQHFISKGLDGAFGANGVAGSRGADGVDGSPGRQDKHACTAGTSSGSDGIIGTQGARGADGEPGGLPAQLKVVCTHVVGEIKLWSVGGDGGRGGNGGTGGNGGKGGNGGYGSLYGGRLNYIGDETLCKAAKGGDGGDGGNGGGGGNGGRSGDGGNIDFSYSTGRPIFSSWSAPGFVAPGGKGGHGGKGGDGGIGDIVYSVDGYVSQDVSNSGKAGRRGIDGSQGGRGGQGLVYVNGKLSELKTKVFPKEELFGNG